MVASRDGKLLATDSSIGAIRLWTRDGDLVREYQGHKGIVPGLRFSPDDSEILTWGWDGTVRLWPVASGADGRLVHSHGSQVRGAFFGVDHVVSVAADATVMRSQAGEGARLLHDGKADVFAVDACGGTVSYGTETGDVHETQTSDGATSLLLSHGERLNALTYSSDCRWLASGDQTGVVLLTERRSRQVHRLELLAPVVAIEISARTSTMVVATEDGLMRVFRIQRCGPVLASSHRGDVKRMTLSDDEQSLAAVCHDGVARILHLSSGDVAAAILGEDMPFGIAMLRGSEVATTTNHELLISQLAGFSSTTAAGSCRALERTMVIYGRARYASPEERWMQDVQEE